MAGWFSSAPTRKVIVYQMGKVASTSLVRTLNRVRGVEAHHSHFLGVEQLRSITAQLADPELDEHFIKNGEATLIQNLGLTRMIGRYKTKKEGDEKVYILTLSREPIGWFASQIIQNVDGYLPGLRLLAGKLTAMELSDREAIEFGLEYIKRELSEVFRGSLRRGDVVGEPGFVEKLHRGLEERSANDRQELKHALTRCLSIFCTPFCWLDDHIRNNFGVDVLEGDYRERPYHFFEGDYFKLLMLKFEALDSAPGVLSEWLGTKIDRLVRKNVSRDKPYRQEISRTVNGFREDDNIMKMVASSRYAKALGYG